MAIRARETLIREYSYARVCGRNGVAAPDSYFALGNEVWATLAAAMRGGREMRGVTYGVRMFINFRNNDFFPQGELVYSDAGARNSLNLLGDSEGVLGDDWNPLDSVTFRIVRMSAAPVAPARYRFNTPKRVITAALNAQTEAKRVARGNLKLLGIDPATTLLATTNCVVSAIRDRTVYYTKTNTTQRGFMWDPTYTIKLPIDAEKSEQLGKDRIYMSILHAYNDLLSVNGWSPTTHDGLNHSQLIYFAEKAQINIVIWVATTTSYLLKRFDTGFYYANGAGRVFHFHMDSVNHLTLFDSQSINIGDEDNVKVMKNRPTAKPKINYVDDAWYDAFFTGPITSSYAVISAGRRRGGIGTTGNESKYAKMILQDGADLFKHVSTRVFIPKDCLADQKYAYVCTQSDLESLWYRDAADSHNIGKVKQATSPRLFEACIFSDQVIGRGFRLLTDETTYYEYDMRAAYCADYSSHSDFPYFHGFPTRNAWSEYHAGGAVPVMFPESVRHTKGITHDTFDFCYGRYAIFQFDPLMGDFLNVGSAGNGHFQKWNLFGAGSPGGYSGFLTSPVLHFRTDMGVKWRASYVWVTHAVSKDWIPIDSDKLRKAKRSKLIKDKTYLELIGKMMCGRDSKELHTYYVPTREDARSITYWYSSQYHDLPLEEKEISPHSRFMVDPRTCKFSSEGEITVVGTQAGMRLPALLPGGRRYMRTNTLLAILAVIFPELFTPITLSDS
jgi:hypothetical protein